MQLSPDGRYLSILTQPKEDKCDIEPDLQKYVEDILGDWLNLILKTTKRNNVCYGGGVAMNVKANGILAKNSYVKDFFVPLSPGDETNIFGGSYLSTETFCLVFL